MAPYYNGHVYARRVIRSFVVHAFDRQRTRNHPSHLHRTFGKQTQDAHQTAGGGSSGSKKITALKRARNFVDGWLAVYPVMVFFLCFNRNPARARTHRLVMHVGSLLFALARPRAASAHVCRPRRRPLLPPQLTTPAYLSLSRQAANPLIASHCAREQNPPHTHTDELTSKHTYTHTHTRTLERDGFGTTTTPHITPPNHPPTQLSPASCRPHRSETHPTPATGA